jgi:hypothetical protein
MTYLKKKKHTEDRLTTHDWKEIANFIPGRTESQCLYKWNLTKHKVSFRKSTWQSSEDIILRELVLKHGKKHWQKIANELNERMGSGSIRAGKQCRERWLNHLDGRIRKDPWKTDEDLTLLTKQQIIGNKWSDIVKYLPGRTENMVKNRFNTLAKQKREEKRNNSLKKLDDIIGGLEQEKNNSEDKEAWVDEKIQELEIIMSKKDDSNNVSLNDKIEGLSMEEKKKMKYEEKKGFKDVPKLVFDKNVESPFMTNQNLNKKYQVSSYINTPKIFDAKDENIMLYDSTPQQYHVKRTPFETTLGDFPSSFDFQKRQLPPNPSRIGVSSFQNKQMPSPVPMRPSEGPKRQEKSKFNTSMLSPNIRHAESERIKNSLNSPS